MRYQLFCYQQMAVNNCLTLVFSCIFITLVPWFTSLYFSMIYVVRSLHHFLTTCSRVCGCGTKFTYVLPRPRGALLVTVVFTYLNSHAVANHLASSSRTTFCYRFIQRSTFDFVPSIKETFVKLSLNRRGRFLIKVKERL